MPKRDDRWNRWGENPALEEKLAYLHEFHTGSHQPQPAEDVEPPAREPEQGLLFDDQPPKV